MKRFFRAMKRLWYIGTCDHMNCGRHIDFDDTTWIRVCRNCGTVMQIGLSEAERGQHTGLVAMDINSR